MINTNDILLPHIIKGLNAGRMRAIEKARQTHTNLVIWQDGKTVEITPDEAEALAQQGKKQEL